MSFITTTTTLEVFALGKKRLAKVRSGDYSLIDSLEAKSKVAFRGKSNRERRARERFRTFTEKSFERWSQYVCGVCKNLVFRRDINTWVCGKGHSITKEYCADFVDDYLNIRIRMPDGHFTYLSEP